MAISSVGIANGQTLRGSVAWKASISGSRPNRVTFSIDGVSRWTQRGAPYDFGGGNALDTTTLANGKHVFRVTAYPTRGTTNGAASQRVEAVFQHLGSFGSCWSFGFGAVHLGAADY